jgi:glycosyltransferase involved in cell wall biosynthesis
VRLVYLANARLPTEKAHGLQIVENCDALARAGAAVTLVIPRRVSTSAAPGDLWRHYGVAPTFTVRRVGCLDLFPLGHWVDRIAAVLLAVTYAGAAARALRRMDADAYYSRDVLPLLALSLFKPRRALAYEAHRVSTGRIGAWLQRACLRRVGAVFAVTDGMAAELHRRGAAHVVVVPDGFRAERFAALPGPAAARVAIGVPEDAFCVGYVGQLETIGMGKGLDCVVDAIARLADPAIHLCLVGGPRRRAEGLRAQWDRLGLSPAGLHVAGDIAPGHVPDYLAAFDVGLAVLPWTEHFAYYASPLKLFEYMAAGLAIVASNLPSIAEILGNDTAVLVPPGDVASIARALAALRNDAGLRRRLGERARQVSAAYTWAARARRVLETLEGQSTTGAPRRPGDRTSQNTQPTPATVRTP